METQLKKRIEKRIKFKNKLKNALLKTQKEINSTNNGKKESNKNKVSDATFGIIAAMLVLFTALVKPIAAFVIAVTITVFYIGYKLHEKFGKKI